MLKIMRSLIMNNKFKNLFLILSTFGLFYPLEVNAISTSKSIFIYEKGKYGYSLIKKDNLHTINKNFNILDFERSRIRRKIPCGSPNIVGIQSFSSMLISQEPKPIPIFDLSSNKLIIQNNSSCKLFSV